MLISMIRDCIPDLNCIFHEGEVWEAIDFSHPSGSPNEKCVLINVIKVDTYSKLTSALPIMLQELDSGMKKWGTTGRFDPFDNIYKVRNAFQHLTLENSHSHLRWSSNSQFVQLPAVR